MFADHGSYLGLLFGQRRARRLQQRVEPARIAAADAANVFVHPTDSSLLASFCCPRSNRTF